MLLRSSSTPILGSLLSPFSESPNRDFENNKNPLLISSEHLKKISFSHGGSKNCFSSFSCIPSPLNRSSSGFSDSDREIGLNGFRRAQSDGNLEGLAAGDAGDAGDACDVEEFHHFKSSKRNSGSMLKTIPSFSIFNSSGGYEDEEDLDEEEGEEDGIELNEGYGFLERSVTIGDSIMAQGSGEFSFEKKMDLIEEEEEGFSDKLYYLGVEEEGDGCRPSSPPMFLARGLGIDVGGFGGGGGGFGSDFNGANFGEGGEDESKTGEYYKKMVEEHPCSALFLRNYAQFLYKTKHDLWGADEYYSRAILADPQDGEILSQYAKLVWELHHDHERASSYFERAVQAAPEDSHVHAAYASFLWETEDIEEEDNQSHNPIGMTTFHSGVMASATA